MLASATIQCAECDSSRVIVDPDTNPELGWCLCGDKAREAQGLPELWEALIAMDEDSVAHEVFGDPFEPVTAASLEREEERNARRTRAMADLRKGLDERFGLSG